MPKQKTHSGTKKRFKITGTGKIKKQGAGMRHNLEKKSSEVTRRLNKDRVIAPADAKVIKNMVMYVTPWGTVKFVPSRENRARDVFIMQDDMWAVGVLRATRNEELAKTGDSEKRQVLTELTLICKNEKASGIIADNTTS
jgi:large subunit ribosomal protein L35